ncbi:hypothetical protein [Antarcticirhabdus aurantiaca]|uniref:Uncharacterized protein n=1 Tax=Antarcticirhabdus aurantiaca TaxID=2606717 RepID=A0ACD4NWN4_9HYPH|nr:hypothetical protein [Antarcticirhabdus aurantiaca]WAJ31163.1 hypothetical protein OXU80_13570 [Jeongeuplla avenae]
MNTVDPNEALRLATTKATAVANGTIEMEAALDDVVSEVNPVLAHLEGRRHDYLARIIGQLKIRRTGYAGERSKLPEPTFYKRLIDRLSALEA